jgi:hypothetical protein
VCVCVCVCVCVHGCVPGGYACVPASSAYPHSHAHAPCPFPKDNPSFLGHAIFQSPPCCRRKVLFTTDWPHVIVHRDTSHLTRRYSLRGPPAWPWTRWHGRLCGQWGSTTVMGPATASALRSMCTRVLTASVQGERCASKSILGPDTCYCRGAHLSIRESRADIEMQAICTHMGNPECGKNVSLSQYFCQAFSDCTFHLFTQKTASRYVFRRSPDSFLLGAGCTWEILSFPHWSSLGYL